jgi:MoaA/NifB/PqqE/SkfB family radical SAM enzyme
MIPIVYSNGSTLTPDVVKFCRRTNVSLVVALDSLEPEVHRLLAGKRKQVLPTVLHNLEHLRWIYADAVEEHDELRVLRLALNMTVCSRNQNEVEAIKAFAGDDMYFVCNPLAPWGNAAGNWSGLIDSEADYVEQQRLVRLHSESGGPLMLDRAGCCGYSANGICVGPQGQYMTCAYTKATDGLLGTVRDRFLYQAFALKYRLELEHYRKHGPVPCLVRDKSFPMFLQSLSRI